MGATRRSSACRRISEMGMALMLAGRSVDAGCPPRASLPEAPAHATDLNGVAWPDFCFEQRDLEEHFFIIGDWGGIFRGLNVAPLTAPNRHENIVAGIDDRAQVLVAQQMKLRAAVSKPRYLLNVGDNFYWGGVETPCGGRADQIEPSSLGQWNTVFEQVYDGPDLAGKPWLGVLGNHDYGGYKFTMGWDQSIAYTWGPSDRWLTPAQYWSTRVQYHDFLVHYVFVESNVNDAFQPMDQASHNICSMRNNPAAATCGATGPSSPQDCTSWFLDLWMEQLPWITNTFSNEDLNETADWRVIVTHYPPDFRKADWAQLAETNKIDLIVTGHRHQQELYDRDESIGGAAWLVSGGGGGITSEGLPREDGDDDMYGFFDVTISKSAIKLESISHSGIVRHTKVISPRPPPTTTTSTTSGTSTTTTTSTTSTTTTRRHDDFLPQVGSSGGVTQHRATLTALLLVAIVHSLAAAGSGHRA